MITFKDKLIIDYPVPHDLSIWGGDGVMNLPVEDLDVLIEAGVDELASDIQIIDYIAGLGMSTHMPESTITVLSAKLSAEFPFQGNRLVKYTYDRSTKICFLRYWPATITYRRKLQVSDLNNLVGDELIYVKTYLHYKMADKELLVLTGANMNVDNGTIDLEALKTFKTQCYDKYHQMKEEIFIYSTI